MTILPHQRQVSERNLGKDVKAESKHAIWRKKFAELKRRESTRRLYRYILYNVAFGLFPVLASAWKDAAMGKGPFRLGDVLANGELYLISSVIAGNALSEFLSGKGNDQGYINEGARFACIFLLAMNSLGYACATGKINPFASAWLFLATVIVSGVCIARSRKEASGKEDSTRELGEDSNEDEE
jgi:hypothetical protein